MGVLGVELGRNIGRLLVWKEALPLSDFKAPDRVATCQTHGCGADHVLATCILRIDQDPNIKSVLPIDSVRGSLVSIGKAGRHSPKS